jgi:uncharacterized protein
MADSIRDQLLGLGFKAPPKPERQDKPARPPGGHAHARPAHGKAPGHAHARADAGRPPGHGHARADAGKPPGHAHARADAGKPAHARPAHGKPPHGGRPQPGRSAQAPQKSRGEMDLAKAYAIRAQKEKDERIAAEKVRQEEAAKRREGKAKLAELLKTASLNAADAEIARHFEYGGKIRRVYVTAEQLKAINAGELAIVQQAGRYHVTTPEHAKQAEALLSGALALLADPSVPSADDQYADPKYQVPDDLIW